MFVLFSILSCSCLYFVIFDFFFFPCYQSDYTESNLDDLFKAVIPTITDNHDLFNISYLPSSLFSNAPSSTDIPSKLHNNLLLLNNPPKKTDQTFDDSLIRGQLKPRMNKNTEITISNGVIPINMKGTLGDGPRGLDFHPMLNMIKKPKINGIIIVFVCSQVYFL
ncbi:unnamed protein product [Trichobilharzia regenti]|nr:unnamed protein product [Trichobilharzia regenti]